MKRLMTLVLLVGVSAGCEGAKAQTQKGMAVLIPADRLAWADTPGMAGVQMAVLEGDPQKGAHHSLVRFAPGFSAGVHHHTADHFVTVVSGTVILTVDGKDRRLQPSSFFAFSGRKPHATRCEGTAPCILSLDARGPWDVVPEDKAAAKP